MVHISINRSLWAQADRKKRKGRPGAGKSGKVASVLGNDRELAVSEAKGGMAVKSEKLEGALSKMTDKALLRFVKRCACRAMLGVGNSVTEAREALDMVYVECSRRGKERLYDSVYASVSQHPERCKI